MSKIIDIDDAIVKTVLQDKNNVFITGSGGVGKSEVIKVLHDMLINIGQYSVKAAPTGIAAFNIGGATINSVFKLGLNDMSPEYILRVVRKYPEIVERIKNMNWLLVDEVSMLGAKVLKAVDHISRKIRGIEEPLGGIKVLFTGDFLQLKPVNDDFIFETQLWKDMKFVIIKLNTPHRFINKEHYNFLQRIRIANPIEEDISKINSRVKAYEEYMNKEEKKETIIPTKIYPLREKVDEENQEELSKLEGKYYKFKCIDTYIISKKNIDNEIIKDNNGNITAIKPYDKYFDESVPKILLFKIGAQVMLTKNISVEDGLTNGSRGIITGFSKEEEKFFIEVLFKNGKKHLIGINNYDFKDEKVKITRYQFPLILAYALTIHKIQGSTLDYGIMELGDNIFSAGMAYVALSRVRSLEGIYISKFSKYCIYANKKALRFEKAVDKLMNKS